MAVGFIAQGLKFAAKALSKKKELPRFTKPPKVKKTKIEKEAAKSRKQFEKGLKKQQKDLKRAKEERKASRTKSREAFKKQRQKQQKQQLSPEDAAAIAIVGGGSALGVAGTALEIAKPRYEKKYNEKAAPRKVKE